MTPDLDVVRQALARYTERLIALPNVVGVGIGERPPTDPDRSGPEPCLAVYVTRKLPLSALDADERIPPDVSVAGVRVRTLVIEAGSFEHHAAEHPR